MALSETLLQGLRLPGFVREQSCSDLRWNCEFPATLLAELSIESAVPVVPPSDNRSKRRSLRLSDLFAP